jgi:hypothetical protein
VAGAPSPEDGRHLFEGLIVQWRVVAGLVGVRDGLDQRRDPDTVIAPVLAQRLFALRAGV